jgi:hypothetical protein
MQKKRLSGIARALRQGSAMKDLKEISTLSALTCPRILVPADGESVTALSFTHSSDH